MIKRKAPGPYEDTVGPILFAILLMIAIIAQFLLKLQSYELLTKLVQVVGVLDDEGTNTTIWMNKKMSVKLKLDGTRRV